MEGQEKIIFVINMEHKHKKGNWHNKPHRGHATDSHKSFEKFIHPDKALIKDISIENKDQDFSLRGRIDKVVQTGGPTVFFISDGTGTLAIKAFEKAGVRAYPHVDVGHAIKVVVTIGEYNDGLEGEVRDLSALSEKESEEFEKHLSELEMERAKIMPPEFLVSSPVLEKLKERFVKAAIAVRLAIFQSRPIIIRHHNDADGYASGYALERAILPLITEQHSSSAKASWEFYTRAPCNAPMYEIDDSIRDAAHSLANVAKFSNKMPLVLIVDTGSGEEDWLGIKHGKIHGMDFIVVDHHPFEKDVISKETIVHINPFLVNEDGSSFSAGMLCTELARFINSKDAEEIIEIAAMAGMADRINNPEVMQEYVELAGKKGYTRELLADIASVIDFVSSKLRFMEAREYIEVIFGEPMEKQKELVSLLAPYISNLEARGLQIVESIAEHEKIRNVHLQTIEIEKALPRGFYPKPGRCVSLVHDLIQEKQKLDKVVTLGILSDAITMRSTDGANFSVSELIIFLREKVPGAFVEGGGHKNAGSIKFVPSKQQEVLKYVKEFIKKRN